MTTTFAPGAASNRIGFFAVPLRFDFNRFAVNARVNDDGVAWLSLLRRFLNCSELLALQRATAALSATHARLLRSPLRQSEPASKRNFVASEKQWGYERGEAMRYTRDFTVYRKMRRSLTTKVTSRIRAALRAAETPREMRTALREAFALRALELCDPVPSPELEKYLNGRADPHIGSRELFTVDGALLPCWLESDLDPADPWLTSPSSYPLYYSLFRHFTNERKFTRFLEIGVRTGYVGSVFARAAAGRSFYLGIDPNIYLSNGLDLAGRSLRALRDMRTDFEYALLEGYSSDAHIQRSALHSGLYDLIHIDGDHSLRGKLLDLNLVRTLTAAGGLVLVDDYDYHGPVIREAIRRALALQWFDEFAYVPSHRGLAVLRNTR